MSEKLKELHMREFELAVKRHDRLFRLKHKCNCKRKVDYGNGETYCEAMQLSRRNNSLLNKMQNEWIEVTIKDYPEDIKKLISSFNIEANK